MHIQYTNVQTCILFLSLLPSFLLSPIPPLSLTCDTVLGWNAYLLTSVEDRTPSSSFLPLVKGVEVRGVEVKGVEVEMRGMEEREE